MALPKFDDLTKTYCDFVGKDEFPALGAYTIKVNSTTAQKTVRSLFCCFSRFVLLTFLFFVGSLRQKLTVSATKTGDLLSTSLKGKHAFKGAVLFPRLLSVSWRIDMLIFGLFFRRHRHQDARL